MYDALIVLYFIADFWGVYKILAKDFCAINRTRHRRFDIGVDSLLAKSLRPGKAHILEHCVHSNFYASRTQDAEVKKSLHVE